MALSEAERADLRAQFGDEVVLVDNKVGAFLFQKPRPIAWTRYLKGIMSDDRRRDKNSDMEQLCRDCLVWPVGQDGKGDLAKLATLFNEFPAIATTLAGELSDLAGAGASHAGKL